MGQRQSVQQPQGRTKSYSSPVGVTTGDGGNAASGTRWLSAQPNTNMRPAVVMRYPGPITQTVPTTRLPAAPYLGNMPPRPLPPPLMPHRPAPRPPYPRVLQPPSLSASQHQPTTTQPTSSTVNVFPVVANERTVNGTAGSSPAGDNASSTTDAAAVASAAAPTTVRDGDNGFLEALHAISLASQLALFSDLKCTVCHKTIPVDNIELHLLTCLTKPQIIYNEDILMADKGECSICFDELQKGNTIARLPCLCVYHKSCIDNWFAVSRCCPEHPDN